MRGLLDLPPQIRKVIAEFVRLKEKEAEERGHARGKADAAAEVAAGLKALSCLMPGMAQTPMPLPPVPLPSPTAVVAVSSEPEVMLDCDDAVMMGLEEAAGAVSLSGVMDDLFGSAEWSDLDRQELLRFVMASVAEAMAAKGRDPEPVLAVLREMAVDPVAFDAALAGEADVWMSWQAMPLPNPRGQYRFKAEDSETGQRKYGQKAIDVMRQKNLDRFAFAAGQGMPFESGDERTLMEHTEAYRKARESVASLRESLASGTPPRPGDLLDYTDYLPLLTAGELKGLRAMLAQSLTKRVRAGKSKADRVAGVSQALARLREAAATITKAVLEHADAGGPDEGQLVHEAEFDPAEFTADEVHLAVTPASLSKRAGDYPLDKVDPSPNSPTSPASPDLKKVVPPKAEPSAKPTEKPKVPAYSDYGVGGQKMEGGGRVTPAEVRARSDEHEQHGRTQSANKVVPPGAKPDVPRKAESPTRGKPLSGPAETTAEFVDPGRSQPLKAPADQADWQYSTRGWSGEADKSRALLPSTVASTVRGPEATELLTPNSQEFFAQQYDLRGTNPGARAAHQGIGAPYVPPADFVDGTPDGAMQADDSDKFYTDYIESLHPERHLISGDDWDDVDTDGMGSRPGATRERTQWVEQRVPDAGARKALAAGSLVHAAVSLPPGEDRDAVVQLATAIRDSGGVSDHEDSRRYLIDQVRHMNNDVVTARDRAILGLFNAVLRLAGPGYSAADAVRAMKVATDSLDQVGVLRGVPVSLDARASVVGREGFRQAKEAQFYGEPDGTDQWRRSGDVQGLLNNWRESRHPGILPLLADAYEEAGAPAEVLRLLRDHPEAVRPGMWFVRGTG